MVISMKDLFRRRNIASSAGRTDGEVISIRNALSNHPDGLEMSLRDAHVRLTQPTLGDGSARGCNDAFERPLALGFLVSFGDTESTKDTSFLVPQWVSVDDRETRTVEGILVKSKITHTDFPPRPWHTYYDWNFFVRVDRQYSYLLSQYNINHAVDGPEGVLFSDVMECGWDTGFFPGRAQQESEQQIVIWPQVGDRIWMVGRWIYDCGHPCNPDRDHPADPTNHGPNKTEIHPPKSRGVLPSWSSSI